MTGSFAALDHSLFEWQLDGQAVVLDNGPVLARQDNFADLMGLGGLEVVVFDPASRISEPERLSEAGAVQHFPHVSLGDGQPATLYTCLDPEYSATLPPLDSSHSREDEIQDGMQNAQTLAKIPIQSLALDRIDGLHRVDWLVLDAVNDNQAILSHGERLLADTLVVQAKIPFVPTHEGQTGFDTLHGWLNAHGFTFYRFIESSHISHLPTGASLEKEQSTQLSSVDVLFVATPERRDALPAKDCEKLAFILDTVYGIHDLSYQVLARHDPARARNYLLSRGYLSQYDDEPDTFTLIAAYSPVPWAA